MNMKKEKTGRFGLRDSIRKQYTLIFMLVLAGTILLCFLINQLCLQRFYVHNKTKVLYRTYRTIGEHTRSGDLKSEEFTLEMEKLIGRYNLDILVMNQSGIPILYTTSDVQLLQLDRRSKNLSLTIFLLQKMNAAIGFMFQRQGD